MDAPPGPRTGLVPRPGAVPPAIPARPGDRGHLTRLKAIVRDELLLPDDAVVILSELRCGDRSCAPVETLVAVLVDGSRRVWRLPGPTCDVAPQALRSLITECPDGGHL